MSPIAELGFYSVFCLWHNYCTIAPRPLKLSRQSPLERTKGRLEALGPQIDGCLPMAANHGAERPGVNQHLNQENQQKTAVTQI